MALNNAQYDKIQREYDMRQLRNRSVMDSRIKEVYERLPEYKQLENNIAECAVLSAKKLLKGDRVSAEDLKRQIVKFKKKKEVLLKSAGYEKEYLEPIYECSDCKDTGYIDGKRCHCFNQQVINVMYEQSNIKSILNRENFSKFTLEYYDNEETDPNTGKTPYENAKNAYRYCKKFIEEFDNKFSNILFYGNVGTGKTFLSNCIAKELIDSRHSVVYFTASQLFDILAKGVFDKDGNALANHHNINDCDLLIIDDLGTEMSNSFTSSQLFLCLNERILREKSTIISTNLNLVQMKDMYTERIFSRILSNYDAIKMYGRDIRIKKKFSDIER